MSTLALKQRSDKGGLASPGAAAMSYQDAAQILHCEQCRAAAGSYQVLWQQSDADWSAV